MAWGPCDFQNFSWLPLWLALFGGALSPMYFDLSIVKSEFMKNFHEDKLVVVANNMMLIIQGVSSE